MKIDKLNLDGKKDSIEVLDKIFSAKINKQLVSNVLYKTNANYKGRKAKTKQKNEIIGSTAKIYSQKGTGNARHASKKAPIFVGGGVAHGPKGESKYKIRKLNKSEKKKSISSIISAKNKDNNLIIFDDFKKEIYQACREMVSLEDRFLDLVFEMGDIDGLSKEDMRKYIRYIADRRLLQLGLKPNYNIKDNPISWLDEVLGVEHQNFFEGRATSYMKAGLRGNTTKVAFR